MHVENIQITLLKLKDGSRLLHLTESAMGPVLESMLNPCRPLLAQIEQLKALFESMTRGADVVCSNRNLSFDSHHLRRTTEQV